ncbi:MAG: hypothetical protein U0841_30795 [Chloroflexia bacterium]
MGSGTTDENGVATLPSASLAGIDVGNSPSGVMATYDGVVGCISGWWDGCADGGEGEPDDQLRRAPGSRDRERQLRGERDGLVRADGRVLFYASGACTIDGTTVTLVATGGCTITASRIRAARGYNGAPDVVRSFRIVPPATGLTAQAATGTYGDDDAGGDPAGWR